MLVHFAYGMDAGKSSALCVLPMGYGLPLHEREVQALDFLCLIWADLNAAACAIFCARAFAWHDQKKAVRVTLHC